MNKKQKYNLSNKIFDAMLPRLGEFQERAERNNLNDAYFIAFKTGLINDIQEVLKLILFIDLYYYFFL